MPRPVKARTLTTFNRDIETLSRLRMAILLDAVIDSDTRETVRGQIDALTSSLIALAEKRD